jgi:hypothetical protein
MSSRLLLLLLLTPLPQEPKKSDEAPERAKRAATVVERLKAEPARLNVVRAAAPVAIPAPQIRVVQGGMRQMTLELKEVDPPKEGEEEVQVGMMARGINIQQLALSRDNFDRWAFDDGLSVEARRNRLKGLLENHLKDAQESRSLEADYAQKLRIAGLGDIKRFLDRIEAARAEFEATRQDFNAGQTFLVQLEPLASEYRTGPFGPDSLFEKALRKIDAERKSAKAETK